MIEDGMGLLERYIAHRKTREDQLEDVLLQNPEPLSCATLVNIVYSSTPKHRFRGKLWKVYLTLYYFTTRYHMHFWVISGSLIAVALQCVG